MYSLGSGDLALNNNVCGSFGGHSYLKDSRYMYLCYVDESGEAGTFQISDTNSNPFFVITGLIIERSRLLPLTHDFLRIKNRFFPGFFNATAPFLDSILVEIKGNELRKALREGNTRRWQQSIGFLDACLNLIQRNNISLLGRSLIKNPGMPNDDAVVYGRSIMHICQHFNMFLEQKNKFGILIADSRKTAQNKRTTHTVFTQQYQARGSSYPYIVDMPVYGHSNNFAMLQLADIVCSGVLFPMLIDAFGEHLSNSGNIHVSPHYAVVRSRYKDAIRNMQFRYLNQDGLHVGGLLVVDKTPFNRKTSLLFQ
jgi:hypothetical protein